MQIVIEIDEARFKDIQRIAEVQIERNHFQAAEQIIANGTPLSKGHGRLIDADAMINAFVYTATVYDAYGLNEMLEEMPTIIEADKGDKE